MPKKTKSASRANTFKKIKEYSRDADPQTASMGRLLERVTLAHGEWIADEQLRGTEAVDALQACMEAYLMLIHSAATMACSDEHRGKIEEYVLYHLVAKWKDRSERNDLPGLKRDDE